MWSKSIKFCFNKTFYQTFREIHTTGNTQPVSHVIFDFGGTIVNPFDMFNHVSTKVASLYADIKNLDTFEGIINSFINKLDLGSQKTEITKLYKAMVNEILERDGIPMISGVKNLIQHLSKHNIPMAIASYGERSVTKFTMDKTIGLNQLAFSHYVAGLDDPEVKNNKPAPDVYLVCAKRFSPPPKSLQNCVIFEDSIRGITGAVETGMKTVLINEEKDNIPDYILNKISVIADSFDKFKPESMGLPPYK